MTRETQELHTRLLRLGLSVEDSREYWRHATPSMANSEVSQKAFEERWFGAKSAARVAYLVNAMAARFKAYPSALSGLKDWDPVELQDRRWVCHWHLQLSDPLYRAFTHTYLAQRLRHPEPTVEKLSALEWLRGLAPGPTSQGRRGADPRSWAGATAERLVSGLVSSAAEAGFCAGAVSPRPLSIPPVSNQALAYLLYALRDIDLEGSLLSNPYLDSTHLGEEGLAYRLQRLPGFSYHKRANVSQLEWGAPTFSEWIRGNE